MTPAKYFGRYKLRSCEIMQQIVNHESFLKLLLKSQIPDFNLDTAIYESSKFDEANQTWNFSFGHNNANGYGKNDKIPKFIFDSASHLI